MGKKKTKTSKKKVAKPVFIPLKFHIPDTIITRFATNMTIQIIENEFKISFFEQKPEMRFEQNQKPPSEIKADCVASVIVTADRLSRFIEVLQDQLNKLTLDPQNKGITL